VVSLHDTEARPIAKGLLGRPVESGFKAQVVDNTDGIVLDHCVETGNPPDAPMLAPAIARIKRLVSKVPRSATADRGYGEAKVEAELHSLGVKHVAIPRKGRSGVARQVVESSRRFRKLIKWAHRIRGPHLLSLLAASLGGDVVALAGNDVWRWKLDV
jgi:transposase, IS5 family